MIKVARLHYEQGMTHQAIADALDVSRVSITRLLAEARRTGVVTVTIHDDTRPFAAAEERLATRLGVREVRITQAANHPNDAASFAREAGEYLGERFANRRSIAVGVSSTVAAAVSGIPRWHRPDVVTIPIGGGWAGPARLLNPDTSAAVTARALGGQAYSLNAPLLAASEELAVSLKAASGVSSVLSAARGADIVVFGIGVAPTEPAWQGAFLASALTEAEQDELRRHRVAGDLSGRCFDADGRPIEGRMDRRVVGLTLDEVRAIPERIAVAVGVHKVEALQAAARGGLFTALVTDAPTAEAMVGAEGGGAG